MPPSHLVPDAGTAVDPATNRTVGIEMVAAEPAEANALIESCDHLPLAMAIIAEPAHRVPESLAIP
jgi:hypothetical protein